MNSFAELVDGDVRGRTNEDLASSDFGKVVDDGRRRNSLARAGRTLDPV